MSRQGVETATRKIADDLLELARSVLESDSVGTNEKIGRNTLRNSALRGDLATLIDRRGDPVISALFNHYVVFLEWTRPPRYKKKPPIGVLREWAQANGIPTDADTLWAVSTAIWRDGHQGRPIFATMDEHTDGLFADDWADELFTAITDDIDKLFND